MTRTYGRLDLQDGRWVIGELEPHVRIKLKAIFPKVPKLEPPPYTFAATDEAATELLWFCDRYPLVVSDIDLAALIDGRTAYDRTQEDVARIFSADYVAPQFAGLAPGQVVRPHQARNVEVLSRFSGLLVADRVGKGKTYTAGAACLLPGALPATIVVPPHLRLQWKKKLEEFTTLSCHVVATNKPYELPPVDVRIFGYTQLAGWVDVLFQCSRLRLGLTATPIFHYGADAWTILRFLRPEVLGSWEEFSREWCGRGAQVSDPKALGTYLRDQHAMARVEGQDDPDPNRIVQQVPHDVDRLAAVEDVLRQLAWTVKHGSFEASGQAARELDMRMRQETGIAKAPFVAKFVRALIQETGAPVMLFGWHRDVYDIWKGELGDLGVVMYTGTESPAAKNRAVETFRAGGAKVFIISLRSGAGLDGLQHVCSTAVIGELDWSPAMHDQCIGRLNREGQVRWLSGGKVDAIFLVTDDGSDPPMMAMNGLKASQAAGIHDPSLGPQRVVSDLSPIEMLIARYLPDDEDEVAA